MPDRDLPPAPGGATSPAAPRVRQASESRNAPLESLRGLAALAVLADHVLAFGPPAALGVGGALGRALQGGIVRISVSVVLFFGLSGYLISRPFLRAILGGRPHPPLAVYYRNRALRLLPLYYLVMLAYGVVLDRTFLLDPRRLLIFASLTQNYFPDTLHTLVDPTWTLALEVAFYLLVPLLALGWARRRLGGLGQAGLARAMAGLYLVSAAGQGLTHLVLNGLLGVRFGTVQVWSALFPVELYMFATGMLLAVLSLDQAWIIRLPAWARRRPAWALGAGLGFLLVLAVPDQLRYPAATLPTFLVLGAVVLQLERGEGFLRAVAWRPLALLGVISYGIYLWHAPVIGVLGRQGWLGRDSYYLNLGLVVVATVALAAVTYALVERPFLMLRRHWADS
ncbi:MAG: acyltransferase family protein [Candidatus Dormibacteria bacterium]